MITLTVGPNKNYNSIQEAINAVVQTASSGGGLTQSVDIIVYEGLHGGFIVPPSGLGTSSTATLTVRAAPNNKVVLSGWNTSEANGHGYRTVGIGVGENNPYLKIRGLKVENFQKGIVFSANCDYSEVQSTIVQLCSNVGIWVYRSDYCQIVNSVLLDCDFNLSITDVDDIFVAHNDLIKLTDPPNPGPGDKCVIHITSNSPTTTAPPGAIVMYNNNVVASGGSKLICYDNNSLAKLRSDNNNLYNVGGAIASSLLQGTAVPDAMTLGAWQALSNNDFTSISEYPPYLITQQQGNSIYTIIDTINVGSFGGVGNGLAGLCNAATASTASGNIPHGTVPQYVDTSLLCETVQSNYSTSSFVRPDPPTIGAFDTLNDPNGFGSSLVPVGVPGSGVQNSACQGGAAAGITTVEEKYGQSVECINPAVVPGFFYAHDVEHYLYSSKVGMYLGDITVTDIILGGRPYDEVMVKVNDKKISKDNWRIDRNVLRIYHYGLDIEDFDARVEVISNVLKWTGDGFDKQQFRQVSRIRDGHTRYLLPYEPTRAAPIVITDDKVNYSDNANMLGWEFKTEWNELENKVELLFGHELNHIENPQFDYTYTGYTGSTHNLTGLAPDNWGLYTGEAVTLSMIRTTTTGVTGYVAGSGSYTGSSFESEATGTYNLYPVIGDNLCVLSGEIRQRIRLDHKSPYCISAYAAMIKDTGVTDLHYTGEFYFGVDFYDIDMRALTGDSIETGYTAVSYYDSPRGMWSRHSYHIASQTDNILNKSGLTNTGTIPENAFYADITIGSTGMMAFDAVSMTQSVDLKDYRRRIRGREATIEFDTGLSDLYHIKDLTITPVRNRNSNGFIYIGPVPARQFDTGAPSDVTTLTDWNWPNGRINYLPWARTSGKNKLRNRGQFNLDTQGQSENVTIQPDIAYPENIQTIPIVPVSNLIDGKSQYEQYFSSGNVGIAGTDFTIRVTDTNGNPYAFEWVDVQLVYDLYREPSEYHLGLLGSRDLGFYREFGNPISVQTDSMGAATVRWIPPSASESMYQISDIAGMFQQDEKGDWFIDNLPYRINGVGHGNAFITTPMKPEGYPEIASSSRTEILGVDGQVAGNGDSIRHYKLPSTPSRDKFELYVNHTGDFSATGSTYDLRLVQSEVPEIIEGEYFIDENTRNVFVRWNGVTRDYGRSISVRYFDKLTYVKSSNDGAVDDRRLYVHKDLKDDLMADINGANPAAITYDIRLDLSIKAKSPRGMSVEYAQVVAPNTQSGVKSVNIRERRLNTAIIGKSIKKRVGL